MSSKLTAKEKKEWDEWVLACKRIAETTGTTQKKETPAQKQTRIKRLLKPENFEQFIHYYFGTEDFKPAPLGWFHLKAIDNLFVKRLRKHIWEWHRESAKSVFADIFVPIHMLVSGTLTGMILASENADKAKNLIKDVEAQLRNNQRLIADFGDFGITGSWMQSFFQTNTSIGFWSFGVGQNPAGVRNGFKRPNLGIVDDADNKDKAKNQELTEERVSWIKGEFMGCLAKDNRYFLYINNRVHPNGITAHMVGDIDENDPKDESYAHIKVALTENPKTHDPIYFDGITEEEILTDLKEKGAAPAWKEYYSLPDCVHKIVDYGSQNALRQLYHKHVEKGNIFTDENMPWCQPFMLSEYDAIVSYCDPAFGESGKGCYKGIVLLGKKGHNYDVLWVWLRQKGNWVNAHRELAFNLGKSENYPLFNESKEQINTIIRHWVESNELQKTELQKTYQLENINHNEPWYPKFDMDKKPDKIGRIETLETVAEHGHLRFNVNMKSNKDMLELRDQLKSFPKGYIDGPDALHGAKTKVDELTRKKGLKNRVGKYIKYQR